MTTQEEQEILSLLQEHTPAPLSKGLLEDLELTQFAGRLATLALSEMDVSLVNRLDSAIFENELQTTPLSPLSGEFLETLSSIPQEVELLNHSPSPLSSNTINKFVTAIEATEKEEVNSKVISFPQSEKKNKSNWKWLSTAAAVAILGVITGLGMFRPDNSNDTPQFTKTKTPYLPETFTSQPISPQGELVNVSLNSTVVETEDHGLIKGQSNQYSRAIKVVSMETCTIKSEDGKSIIVQKPVEKLILVPATTD